MKTLLTNAKIYDGTGKDAYTGSVLIENDIIVAAGTDAGADCTANADRQSTDSRLAEQPQLMAPQTESLIWAGSLPLRASSTGTRIMTGSPSNQSP